MSKHGSNSELFAHENDALTARPQLHNIHLNIASLSKHKSDLETLLAILNYNFDIITITETKIQVNKDPMFGINVNNYY